MYDTVETLRVQLIQAAHSILRSGAISMSGHGNISIRIPGKDEMLFTTATTLNDFKETSVARVHLDGRVLEGEVPPIQAAVISMHTLIYQERPDTGCVIHTHSPYATAFAVANRPIEGWTEAFGIFGLEGGVPLVEYGARGSAQAIQNIRNALSTNTRAVILANHGILCFHTSPQLAVQVNVIVEEAAQSAIFAAAIGGPKTIPPELLHQSRDRAEEFDTRGPQRA